MHTVKTHRKGGRSEVQTAFAAGSMIKVWRFTWSYVRINDGALNAVLRALEGAACPNAPPETLVGTARY